LPTEKLGFHKRAVRESIEQILWLRKLSLGVKRTAARFKSRWLEPAVTVPGVSLYCSGLSYLRCYKPRCFELLFTKSYTDFK
jgi:hypothetical protein